MVERQPRITGAETSNGATEKCGISLSVIKQQAPDQDRQRMLGILTRSHIPDGLSLAELSSRLGSPKSSLLTLLRPMVADNFLTHTNSRYTLGNESFALATSILSTRKFQTVVRGDGGVAAAVPGDHHPAVVDRAAQQWSIPMCSKARNSSAIRCRGRSSVYTSAAAQVLLAHQDENGASNTLNGPS